MNKKEINDLLRRIPKIDKLLLHEEIAPLREKYPVLIPSLAKETAAELREAILQGKSVRNPELQARKLVKQKLEQCLTPKLKRVINATGVILHTGLGRAPLSPAAQANLTEIARSYSNVEYNLETGKRGERLSLVDSLLCQLTGAEMSAVVNNNAAAVLLALNSLAYRKEVIVSRGELVEIGGSFRIPAVMKKSGAKMVEVGTTNKTRISDYENAITKRTGAILKVHTSNYRVMGFVEETGIEEVVQLGRKHDIPVISDLGGGVLIDLQKWGLPYEPVVEEHVRAGADLVTFSGDKVLGGPQSGIIAGREWAVKKCRKNHLMRTVRVDKLIYAALEPTLKAYLSPDDLQDHIPALKLMSAPAEEVRSRASKFADWLQTAGLPNLLECKIVESFGQAGSGALPLEKLPSFAVVLKPAGSTTAFARRLWNGNPAIVSLIHDDEILLDFRTVFDWETPELKSAVIQALNSLRVRKK